MTESEEYDRKDPSIRDARNVHLILIVAAIIVFLMATPLGRVYTHVTSYLSERAQLIATEVDTALKRSTNYPR